MSQIVIVNVGGQSFTTTKSTLCSTGRTIFSVIFENIEQSGMETTLDKDGNIFMDRSPDLFEYVLQYLRTANVYNLKSISEQQILEEFIYYGIEYTPTYSLKGVPNIKDAEELYENNNGMQVFMEELSDYLKMNNVNIRNIVTKSLKKGRKKILLRTETRVIDEEEWMHIREDSYGTTSLSMEQCSKYLQEGYSIEVVDYINDMSEITKTYLIANIEEKEDDFFW